MKTFLKSKKTIYLIASTLFLMSCMSINAADQSTPELISCLQAYHVYDSNLECDNYVITLNELLGRIDENEHIPEIIASEIGQYREQDLLNSMALIYLNEKATIAIPIVDNNIKNINNTEKLLSSEYIYYQLFFLGVMEEHAICALPNVHKITQLPPLEENSISHVRYQNLAYWVIEQLLGDSRNFSLPSDEASELYGEWTTNEFLSDLKNKNEIVDDFQIYIDNRFFELKEERYYFYTHLPEDNDIIEKWWQEKGQYMDWNACGLE